MELAQIDLSIRDSYRLFFKSRRVRIGEDLVVLFVFALTLPVLLWLPAPLLRVPIGLAMVLGAPGYALTAAIFPRRCELDGVTRTALSFGLSVAVVPILALFLSLLPWGIRPWPIALSLSIWILVVGSIAMVRRWTLDPSGEEDPTIMVHAQELWRGVVEPVKTSPRARALVIAGALLVITCVLLAALTRSGTTEFYLLGSQGQAEDYPRSATPGETLTATIGVVNDEPNQRTYRIEVWVIDALGSHQRVLVGQDGPITLSPNQHLERLISWRMPRAESDQEVDFLLYVGDNSKPYRQLRLWMNVGQQIRTQ